MNKKCNISKKKRKNMKKNKMMLSFLLKYFIFIQSIYF